MALLLSLANMENKHWLKLYVVVSVEERQRMVRQDGECSCQANKLHLRNKVICGGGVGGAENG